jgi:hypothetical protein
MSEESNDATTTIKADVQLMRKDIELLRKDMHSAFTELKRQLVWYMLAFALAQVALEVGLIHALR